MDIFAEYIELAENRKTMYGFLARVYRKEVDAELLSGMKELSFSASASEGEFAEGACLLDSFLSRPGLNVKTDLAVDYARVFLAAGIPQGGAAFPYESVYTSEDRLMMQEARDEAVAIYRSKGLARVGKTFEPEDHIALELELMAFLCQEGEAAAHEEDASGFARSLCEQKSFLSDHLLKWVPEFCSDIDCYSKTDFYRAIAKMTIGFLRMDLDLLGSMTKDE